MSTPAIARWFSALRRRIDPGSERTRELLGDVSRHVAALDARLTGEAERQKERTATLTEAARTQQAHAARVDRELAWMRAMLVRQRKVNSQLLRRADLAERTAQYEQRVRDRLLRLSRSKLPIIVGPWTGEVGFELLYWVPFLQWACERFSIDRRRLIVLSRGGVLPWYAHLADRYADAFSFVSPEAFRDATEAVKKQRSSRTFDRQLVRSAMRAHGLTRAHVLHPKMMYDLFWSFWGYATTVRDLDKVTSYRALTPPALPAAIAGLPRDYVAVRFYFSRCLPETPENRAFVERTLMSLTAQTHVVMLNTPFTVDDHRDFTMGDRSRIHSVADRMTPETNLAVQTAVVANARAFVGTYGGYSYLAPLYGVDSIAFYSKGNFKRQHLDLAHRVFARLGTARLLPVDVRSADSMALAFGALAPTDHRSL
jgi:hypothetical protein